MKAAPTKLSPVQSLDWTAFLVSCVDGSFYGAISVCFRKSHFLYINWFIHIIIHSRFRKGVQNRERCVKSEHSKAICPPSSLAGSIIFALS